MIFSTAERLVERLYRAAVCQAIEQRWLVFTVKMELFVGGCVPLCVAMQKVDLAAPIMMVIGGVCFRMDVKKQRGAAAALLLLAVWPKDGDEMSAVMERHEQDPIAGRGDYGLNWLWNGYSGGSVIGGPRKSTTMYRAALEADSVPAAEQLIERLEKMGFSLDDRTLDATRREIWTEGQPVKVCYSFDHTMRFVKGKAALVARVRSGWFGTVSEAVETATAVVEAIWHRGDLVPGGKGQLTKCKRIARELWRLHGHLVETEHPQIVVPYLTRGGRGGWKQKTARRQFSPADLKDAPPKVKAKRPGIRVTLELEAGQGWGKVGPRVVRLLSEGNVEMRHGQYAVEVEGEWALLRRKNVCYRMSSIEWRRLQVKAKLQ